MAVDLHTNSVWMSGIDGIGRHARFRFLCRKAYGFESHIPHGLLVNSTICKESFSILRRSLVLFITSLSFGWHNEQTNEWVRSQMYPSAAVEKSVASEVVYYMESHLTKLDLIAKAADDAMQEVRRYLTTGSSAFPRWRMSLTSLRR